MKKITKIFVLAIASMVALASCQKVNDVEATFQPKVLKAVFEDELSKTVLSENFQIQWSDSDKITGFDLDCKNYTSTETSVSEDKLEATFTFGSVSLEDDIVYAMYPADAAATMTSGGVITTTLPLVQNAVAGSFDPKANLALANGGEENVKFFNAGGLLAFDIKNDNITKIEIEAGSYENFAGPAILNFAEGEALLQSTYESDLHKVTLQGEFVNGKTYYAVVIPGDYSSLKMVFTRNDGKTATFTNSKTLTVLRNGVVTVWKNAIDDSKWQGGEPQSETWTATAYADIADGDELVIVGDNGDTYAMSNDNGTSDAPDAVEVTIEGNDLASTPADNIIWVAGKDSQGNISFYLSDAQAAWLYCTNSNNGVRVGTNTNKTFTLDASSGYLKHNGTSRFLGIYNDADWRCYTSPTSTNIDGQTFKFYVKKGGATKYSVTCAEVTGGTIAADVVKAEAGATVTLTATPNTGYEFESWNVTNASTSAAITVADNKFTMPAANVNVSATFKEKESEALTTMDEIFAAATTAGSTATDVKVKFNNWVVSGVKNNNAYLTDNNGKGLIIYTSGHGFVAGDILSGTVSCKVQLYKGASELTALTSTTTGLTVTKGGVITPTSIAIKDLGGVNTGAVVKFDELTYNGTDFTDGTNSLKPYGTFITLPTLANGKKYSVTGVYIQFDTTKEIAPRTAEDIVEKAATKYAVSVAIVANGSLSVDCSQATEGQTVTITATPASGYKLKAGSVKVTKASSGTVTVTNDKTFTMPAEAVTVSAEFEVNSDPKTEKTATIKFSTNDVKINAASVTGDDDKKNTWTITTVGTSSFTPQPTYCQIGSSKSAATSITFKTTLPSDAEVTSISAKFGGFSSTAGTVTLKVGNNSVGTGSLNAANDVTVTSTSTASGNVITITVTGIAKGVKVYNIETKYKSAN